MSNEKPIDRGTRIRHVRFAVPPGNGIIVGAPNEAFEHCLARETESVPGYDIWFEERRQRFRFDYFRNGKYDNTRYMHVSQVRTYQEWDPPADRQSKSAE
jgi:hypothetical protein